MIQAYARDSQRPTFVVDNISMQLLENGRMPKEDYTLDPMETLSPGLFELRTSTTPIAPAMKRAAEMYRDDMSTRLEDTLTEEFNGFL